MFRRGTVIVRLLEKNEIKFNIIFLLEHGSILTRTACLNIAIVEQN